MTQPFDRPAIPAELRRRVLVEAGHRCAIPTCRHIEVEIHHITPWAQSPEHTYENLIALCPNCHSRADRDEIDRKSLRLYKANLRFTHDKFSQFEVDVLFNLYSIRTQQEAAGLLFPHYMRILITRIDESGFISWTHVAPNSGGVFVAGVNTAPSLIRISDAGKNYIDSLGLEDRDAG